MSRRGSSALVRRALFLGHRLPAWWLGVSLGLFLGACDPPPPATPKAPAPETYTVAPALSPPSSAAPASRLRFTDVRAASGIAFTHTNDLSENKYAPETMGSGVCLFDADGDGHLDAFFVNGRRLSSTAPPGEPPITGRLYRGDGKLKFTEVTAGSGLGVSLYGMGCTSADIEGDGDADLLVTSALEGNRLFRNDGTGRFTDTTAEAGLTAPTFTDGKGKSHPIWTTSAAFLDYDRDGRPDLYVCSYIRWSIASDIFTTRTGLGKSFTTPELYKGETSRLYHNLGGGRFEDTTERAGVLNREGKSLGVAVADLDDDGFPDLVVANDTQPNYLYRNKGDGTFESAGLAAGIAYDAAGAVRAGMGIDVGAPMADGQPTIAIGNFSREPVSLYHREKGLFFVDAAGRTRLSQPTLLSLTFGLSFLDADLDGFTDLVLANGHIEPEIGRVEQSVTYAEPAQLFLNQGGESFVEVTQAVGPGISEPMVGRGLAYGDLDEDGDLDLVITSNGGVPRILRNDDARADHHWIRFKLRGAPPGTDALGARVTVTAGGRTQTQTVRTGSSYLSQSERALTFGLGTTRSVDAVEVRWPGLEARRLEPSAIKVDAVNELTQR